MIPSPALLWLTHSRVFLTNGGFFWQIWRQTRHISGGNRRARTSSAGIAVAWPVIWRCRLVHWRGAPTTTNPLTVLSYSEAAVLLARHSWRMCHEDEENRNRSA